MIEKTHISKCQAVIFDLDGVLMDSEWLAYTVWRELAELHGGQLNEKQYIATIGTTVEETAEHILQHTGARFDVAEGCAWIWKRMDEVMSSGLEPLPGAAELVDWLVQNKYHLAVASNSITSYVDTALRGLNLISSFPVRVGIDQVTNGKPAPDVYLRAAQKLGIDPQHCLAVEDSRVGVRAAVAAGMRVAAVPSPFDPNREFPGAWKVYASLVQMMEDLGNLITA